MTPQERFTIDEARVVADKLAIDYTNGPFDLEQFRMGLDVELEHGTHDPETDVTGDDPILTGKIASRTCGSCPTTTPASRSWRARPKDEADKGESTRR